MKKVSHIIITLFLLVSTTGITISKHYSMGELYDASFIGEADRCCSEPCDCCEDEFEFYRLEVEFVGSDVQFSFNEVPSVDLLIITVLFDLNENSELLSNETDYTTNLPPPKNLISPAFTQSFLL